MTGIHRRHIIIEGCDASGKDTLIRDLIKGGHLDDYVMHERASTSLGGPVSQLDDWVEKDLIDSLDTSKRYVYNRHPLVSEVIYAPYRHIRRGLHGRFKDHRWVAFGREVMSRNAVLVICQPPMSVVGKNIEGNPTGHMPGVLPNWHRIYTAYQGFVWSGATVRYDYTKDTPETLMKTVSTWMEKPTNG